MNRLRLFVFAVVFGALAFAPAIATAAPDKREVQARTDFAAGRYQQAIELFAQLYGETLDPIHLRNIARCHQKMQQPQKAIDGFRDYLRKAKNLSDGERVEIDGYIKEMQALQAAPPVAPSPPIASPPPATVDPAPEPAAAPPAPVPAAAPATASPTTASPTLVAPPATAPSVQVRTGVPDSDGTGWRVLGVVTTLAGVAMVGGGVALGLSARNASSEVSKRYDQDRAEEGERNETLSWVGYGVGAAAIAGGILMYAHGMSIPPTSIVGLRPRPMLGSHWAGLTFGGAF